MARVLVATQPWGILWERADRTLRVPLPGTAASINTTVYSAATGTGTVASFVTNSDGELPGYVEEGSYTLTVSGESFPVPAVAGGLPGVVGDGVVDDTAALTSALATARAAGRMLHVPAGTYRVTGAITGSETTAVRIKGAGKGLTTFSYTGNTAAMIGTLGSIAAITTLTAPSARGASTLTVGTTTGLAVGDLVVVRDPTVAILGNSTKTQAAAIGQMRKIKTVDSATQITVRGRLSWAFTTGSDVRKITPVKGVTLSDFSVVNPAPGTLGILSRAINLTYTERIDIARLDFRDLDATAIYPFSCWDFRIADCDFYEMRDLEQTNNPYSINAAQGTQFGLVTGCKQHYGRHLFTTAPKSDGTEIPTQDIIVSDCSGIAMTQTVFDTHPGACRIHFSDCSATSPADKAFQIRGPDCTLTNPIVDGATIGILAVDGADRLRVQGGVLGNCDVGVEIQDSNDVRVRGTEIDDPITTGLKVVQGASWTDYITRLRLRDIAVRGNPSGAAFDFSSRWHPGFDLRGLAAREATTKITGAPTTPTLNGLHGSGHAGDAVPTDFAAPALTFGVVANEARLSRYVPPTNRTITKLAFIVTTASGADDAFDVGVYSLSATASVLTLLVSTGAVTGASGVVSGGGLNSTGRKVITIPSVDVVGGTVYYVAISVAAAGATLAAGGLNATTANQLMGTGVPDIIAGAKATSHPLPATISGPSQQLSGPKMGVLE